MCLFYLPKTYMYFISIYNEVKLTKKVFSYPVMKQLLYKNPIIRFQYPLYLSYLFKLFVMTVYIFVNKTIIKCLEI